MNPENAISSFNVLERSQNVHRHYVLEASAGTGKTFAIENVTVRLLIEAENPLSLENILLVTFTKAAANDLKVRIRSNIQRVLKFLKNPQESIPDYVKAVIEKGQDVVEQAKRNLEQALFVYDQAQIFTIHSFCWHMLRGNALEGSVSLGASGDVPLSKNKILKIVQDYLRTGLQPSIISQEQLQIVLNNKPIENLFNTLFGLISKGVEFAVPPPYEQQLESFQRAMKNLAANNCYAADKILTDFISQAKGYSGTSNKKGEVYPHLQKKVSDFANLLQRTEWNEQDFALLVRNGLSFIDALDPEKKKASYQCKTVLHYPDLSAHLGEELAPLVAQARSEEFILSRMAHDCQKLLKTRLYEEEILRYDDLLEYMVQGLQNDSFKTKIQERYHAAIIDEFQDTDPCQWKIFKTLFLDQNWKGFLYLVGDPKQSIYAFRQADIYTYLDAGDALGNEKKATLDVNYRSQPPLVDALNFLFSATPNLISLPMLGKTLEYQPVKAGMTESKNGPALIFLLGKSEARRTFPLKEIEEDVFFPQIVQELLGLKEEENLSFSECAILVNDRYQAERISRFLKKYAVPCVTQRTRSLAESPAVAEMRDLLNGVLHHKQESALKTALGGRILGWTHEEVSKIQFGVKSLSSDHHIAETIVGKFQEMRSRLLDQGFIAFFEEILQNVWHDDGWTAEQRILMQTGGDDFFQELQQVSELIAEYQCSTPSLPENLLTFLDQLSLFDQEEDPRLKILSDSNKENVQILTIHSSKGLEFDTVFAIGLAARSKEPSLLVPLRNGICQPVIDNQSEIYFQYCQELDAEKSRQLYVAMTRAKSRLYLPVVLAPNVAAPKPGRASPMELFLVRLGQPKADLNELYERIESYDESILQKFIAEHGKELSISLTSSQSIPIKNYQSTAPLPVLIEPRTVNIPGKIEYIHSFTSLSKASTHPKSTSSSYSVKSEKNPHTLPLGAHTGILLHEIMEKIPYHKINSEQDVWNFIGPMIENTEFAEWKSVLCQIVFNCLNTPLKPYSFLLKEVLSRKIYREMDFLYPAEEGFIKGVIDLFFEHEGKFFLLDWKSNWLGSDRSFYKYQTMHQAMTENQYFLQASLYQDALKKYVKLFDERPFHEIFGGTYYLFMRGVNPESDEGIFYLC